MPQAGLLEPREDTRPARAVIDFGVDGSWEPAPARSRRQRIPIPVTSDFAALPAAREDGDHAVARSEPRPSRRSTRAERSESRASVAFRPDPRRSRATAEPAIRPVAPSRRPAATVGPSRRPAATDASSRRPAATDASSRRPAQLSASPAAPERRTIQIRGRGAEGYAWSTATTFRSASAARGSRRSSPDRMALWAVLLGLLLVLIAATSAHAAALPH